MGKKLYGLVEKIAFFFLGLLFKLMRKEMTQQVRNTFSEFIKFGLVGVSNTTFIADIFKVKFISVN